MKYRIKIEEKFNGEKCYIPQCGIPKLRNGMRCWLSINSIEWKNIIPAYAFFILSTTSTESHDTEEKALEVIDAHKAYIAKENGKKIKSTTYKTID